MFAYNPPTGGEDVYELFSPVSLGAGPSVTGKGTPQADAINPALSGDTQRLTLDAGYINFSDLVAGTGIGHAGSIGFTLPTKVGVFTWSAQILSSALSSVYPLGTFGSLNFSFSKDLFPELLVGAGLHLTLGSKDVFDWGLAADLGMLHQPGNLGLFKDFRWAVVLRNFGKPYAPVNTVGITAFPSPFTLAAGTGFSLIKTETVNFALSSDISFPSFQNILFSQGANLSLFDFFYLSTAFDLNLRDLVDQKPVSFIPSVGMSFRIKIPAKDEDQEKTNPMSMSEIHAHTAVNPLYNGIWGFSGGITLPFGALDRTPPVLNFEYKDNSTISPNNDGVQDDIEFPFSLSDERYIMGYRMMITNDTGEIVREIVNKDERPENLNLKNIVDRLLYVKQGIQVPEKLRWDGYTDTGTPAPDGRYFFTIEAWDDNGNRAYSAEKTVYIDTKAPEVTLVLPENPVDRIFSPDNDGNKDTLRIEQRGSIEDLWKGRILNARGETVREFVWEKNAPMAFDWDGRDSNGVLAPDGVYEYIVTATDRGGNSASASMKNIIINTQRPPINIIADMSFFSPNNDGVQDAVTFSLDVPVKTGVLQWNLDVKNEAGDTKRMFKGQGNTVPDRITFDGKDDVGRQLPEGRYQGTLTILYENGHKAAKASPMVTLDVTAPASRVSAEYKVFSPNGDGRKDTIVFSQTTSSEPTWTGTVFDEAGKKIKTMTWKDRADSEWAWDGRTDANILAPDGIYTYRLSATDRAGNTGISEPLVFRIDTRETPVRVSTDFDAFSPNGDGIRDRITILPNVAVEDGIEKTVIRIRNSDGSEVRTFQTNGGADKAYVWDGSGASGTQQPDGTYTAELEVLYQNGNLAGAKTASFTLDRIAPSVSVAADYSVFSPNGDGNKDVITFTQDTSEEERWEGIMKDARGKTVKTFAWQGKAAASVVWDGRGDDNKVADDGTYEYTITSTDRAGNRTVSKPIRFELNTEETPVFFAAGYNAFSPNQDGVKDTMPLIPQLKIQEGIQSFTLRVLKGADGAAGAVKTIQGKDKVEKEYQWDGKADTGRLQPDSAYIAEIEIVYVNGNVSKARTAPFILDTVAPSVQVKTDMQVFSPNGDGRKDSIVFAQKTSEEDMWTGIITDGTGFVVKKFSWVKQAPETLSWDGRGDTNALVKDGIYTYQLSATDAAGNVGSSEKIRFEVDTAETPVSIATDLDAFSPNGDRVKEQIRLLPSLKTKKGVDAFTLLIKNDANETVKAFQGTGASLQDSYVWDGKDDKGALAPDGRYTAVLSVSYAKGNLNEARTAPFMLDTKYPEISIRPDITLFSPNGDGKKDTVTFIQSSSKEHLFEFGWRIGPHVLMEGRPGESCMGWHR